MSIRRTRTRLLRRPLAAAALALAAGTTVTLVNPATAAAAPLGDAEKSILLVGITWEGFVHYPTDAGTLAWSDPVSVFATCTGWFASEEGHIVTAATAWIRWRARGP